MHDRIWYSDGLRFSCFRCGKCCTGEPGYVWLSEDDIETITRHMGVSVTEFRNTYCRNVGEKISLLEYPNGDCVFYEREKGCRIYSKRPAQCKRYPFWPVILRSRNEWEHEKRRCQGMGRGRRHDLKSIQIKLLAEK